MKFLLVTSLVLCATFAFSWAGLTEEQVEKLQQHRKICSEQSKVDQELVQKAKKGEFTDDQKLKEYLLCLTKRIGFINEAGELQKDVLNAKIGGALGNPALAEKLTEECAIQKSDPLETTVAAIKCYYEKTPNNSLIV